MPLSATPTPDAKPWQFSPVEACTLIGNLDKCSTCTLRCAPRLTDSLSRRIAALGHWPEAVVTASSVLRRVEACQPTLRTGMGDCPQNSAPTIRNVQGSTSLAAVSTVTLSYYRLNKKSPPAEAGGQGVTGRNL